MALERVVCVACEDGYFVDPNAQNIEIPQNAKSGEAFPCRCPYCSDGDYAFLPDKEK